MKIDAASISPSVLQNERSAKSPTGSESSTATQGHAADRTTFSSDAASVKSLVSQAMATPDIRYDKVAQLKQAVSSGSYTVDTQKLAAALTANNLT